MLDDLPRLPSLPLPLSRPKKFFHELLLFRPISTPSLAFCSANIACISLVILEKLGRSAGATAHWQHYRELDPGGEFVELAKEFSD